LIGTKTYSNIALTSCGITNKFAVDKKSEVVSKFWLISDRLATDLTGSDDRSRGSAFDYGFPMTAVAHEGSEPRRTARGILGILKWHISRGTSGTYAFATLYVAVASLLHWGLALITEDHQHFATYYPAVLFAALLGGAGAGAYAAVLSGIIAWWAFMVPHFAFLLRTNEEVISLLIYLFASLLIVWAADHYRTLTKRLEDEEKFRKLAVEELAHRLKNKIATIQSIISFKLRDSPQTREAILGCLTALSATDDLILATQGQGARLRDILSAELGPYEASRIVIQGPVIVLSPKLAMTMALLVHVRIPTIGFVTRFSICGRHRRAARERLSEGFVARICERRHGRTPIFA
jgi:HWE histidine kinase/Domain of unknown function (DUF4118)